MNTSDFWSSEQSGVRAMTVICGIWLKKSLTRNICIYYRSFCIWEQIVTKNLKSLKKCGKPTSYYFINTYSEITGSLLTFFITRAMICEILIGNPPDSRVVLYWPASILLVNFWLSQHYSHLSLWGIMWISYILQFLYMGPKLWLTLKKCEVYL